MSTVFNLNLIQIVLLSFIVLKSLYYYCHNAYDCGAYDISDVENCLLVASIADCFCSARLSLLLILAQSSVNAIRQFILYVLFL